MASINIWFIFVFSSVLWNPSIAGTRSARIKTPNDAGRPPNTLDESGFYQRIEFNAESLDFNEMPAAVPNGDLEIAYVLEQGTDMFGDVEPGFDFTPDLGPLPVTFTVTIKEGESESSFFVLQILDDCHREFMESIRIRPAGTMAYTNTGISYRVDQAAAEFVINDTPDTDNIIIQMDPAYPSIGFVFFEGETGATIPVKGLECPGLRELPLDDTCKASITRTGSTGGFMIASSFTLSEDVTEIPVEIFDDDEIVLFTVNLRFTSADCTDPPLNTGHVLNINDEHSLSIIDNDEDSSYGIIYPPSIGQESRDVVVCAVTTQVDTPTDITRNDAVYPYTTKLPLCKSTELACPQIRSEEVLTYGQCTTFPKPKSQSRDRFGSYIVSAEYDPVQDIPVFIRPLGDAVTPLRGPTITINNLEDVVIGVKFSAFVRELRWFFKGKEVKKYRGNCNFEIKKAEYGVHDGFYEVYRVQRGESGYRSIIRLIIRRCEEGQYLRTLMDGALVCVDTSRVCRNGGVLRNDLDSCECPLGFYGLGCETIDPHNFRIGPVAKRLSCHDVNKDIPTDCKGALFCFRDPLGCLCARGYWGPKCDRVCPHGRFGWSCLQRCNCVGPWDSCDPKIGLCKSGRCKTGFMGPNCQQL